MCGLFCFFNFQKGQSRLNSYIFAPQILVFLRCTEGLKGNPVTTYNRESPELSPQL
jgi:hypothetical protein